MKKFLSAVVLYLTMACSWVIHPVDHNTVNSGKFKQIPHIFVHLGTADQVCASKLGTAEVLVFITLVALPEQPIRIVLDDSVDVVLYGTDVTLDIEKAGVGTHFLKIYAGEHYAYKTFSVWPCEVS